MGLALNENADQNRPTAMETAASLELHSRPSKTHETAMKSATSSAASDVETANADALLDHSQIRRKETSQTVSIPADTILGTVDSG